ncbi:MAG TPA: hypothetical protein VMV74_06305 [Bacteroidales bacterium]|nr:hypothetical protein [Bacteroidales bacterium]
MINMRLILLLLSMATCLLQAQEIKVAGTRQLTRHGDGAYIISAVSPDGKRLLLTESNYKGISLMDKRRGKIIRINEMPGAGFEPCFTADGRFIIFKADEYEGIKKLSSMLRYEMATGETQTLVPQTRNLTAPAVSGGRLFYLSQGKLESSGVDKALVKSSASDTVLLLEDMTPVICINGERKNLRPNGEGSYIWASLSPDKTKILYYFTGKGTFISDLDGKILFSPGRISAPKWLNNQIIIGMDDRDDGYRVTRSEIVSFSLGSNQTRYLTSSSSRKEMYPFPFPGGKSIVFQTPEGELFVMKLRIRL